MKKNLLFLTGIVLLITILVAGGCGDRSKKDSPPNDPEALAVVAEDPTEVAERLTTVEVYLREIEIGGSMHLLMSDSRKPDFEVIDGLITDVNRGDTVLFMKGKKSRIESVEDVRLLEVEGDPKIYKERIEAKGVVYYELILDANALPNDTLVKYEIDFTVKNHEGTTYTVDPYLKIPKQQ